MGYGDYKIANEKGQVIKPLVSFYKRVLKSLNSKELLLIVNYIIQPSTFWRKELINRIGFFLMKIYIW